MPIPSLYSLVYNSSVKWNYRYRLLRSTLRGCKDMHIPDDTTELAAAFKEMAGLEPGTEGVLCPPGFRSYGRPETLLWLWIKAPHEIEQLMLGPEEEAVIRRRGHVVFVDTERYHLTLERISGPAERKDIDIPF